MHHIKHNNMVQTQILEAETVVTKNITKILTK